MRKNILKNIFKKKSNSKSLTQEIALGLPKYYLDTRNNPQYSEYCIGRFTYGEPTVMNWGEASLEIGSFCSISTNVTILVGGNHRTDWVTTFPFSALWEGYHDITGHPATNGNVIIGNDVWIGTGVTILSGVTIEDGAVIGAGSVVTKNVAPYTIVAGNPARLIRKRFDDDLIDKLLKIKWWEWNVERIRENIHLMLSQDIEEFIRVNELK